MQHVAPSIRSASYSQPLSIRKMLSASVSALALFGRDTYAAPASATHSQKSALANCKTEPDFNVNGVQASLKTPSNFALYPNGNPSPADIDQTVIGDCYVDATLAAFAQQGSKVVHDMISSNKGGTYTVHMYDPAGQSVKVCVTTAVPEDLNNNVVGVAGPTANANWATLAEKAYAKYNDVFHTVTDKSGYQGIGKGGDPGLVYGAFMGVHVDYNLHTQYTTSNAQKQFASTIQKALRSGKPVVAASDKTVTLPSGAQIVGSHAYTVMQIEKQHGHWIIEIRNPWGSTANVHNSTHSTDDGVLRMPFADYLTGTVLTYIPQSSIKGADKSDTYKAGPGQQPINGDPNASGANPALIHQFSGLGVAALAGAILVPRLFG